MGVRSSNRQFLVRQADGSLKWQGTPAPKRKTRPRWPLLCEALAVHPSQIDGYIAADRQAGVPTDYDRETGSPIMRDYQHYRHYRRRRGAFDKKGFTD